MPESPSAPSPRERENRILLSVTAGLGCFLIACAVMALLVVGLALIWTLQGNLGPGNSLLPLTTLTA